MPSPIPRRLIQTHKSRARLSKSERRWISTWLASNPTYEYLFFDDAACEDFVRTHFPQHWDAYSALPRAVEKADLFRYMAVLQLGGYYADTDTTCFRDLDALAGAQDTCIVGVEHAFLDDQEPSGVDRQYCQWFFGAVAGHPFLQELVQEVADNARSGRDCSLPNRKFSATTNKTGPVIFTRVANRHLNAIRVLPQAAFGTIPRTHEPWSPVINPTAVAQDVWVRHHFQGSWKMAGRRETRLMALVLMLVLLGVLWLLLRHLRRRRERLWTRRIREALCEPL